MYSYFIVLILIPGIFGKCRSPIKNITETCAIRNLTVVDNIGRILASDNFCNGTIQSLQLKEPLKVNFSSAIMLREIQNRRYLLAVVDFTSNQLLWMVANVTTNNGTRRLLPVANNARPVILKPYQEPVFNSSKRSHQINFFVFEEIPTVTNVTNIQLTKHEIQSFNLTKWLEKQFNEENIFCGPVAGALLTVVTSNPTSGAEGSHGSSFNLPPIVPLPGGPVHQTQPQNNFSTWHSHHDHGGHGSGTWSSHNGPAAYNSSEVHRPVGYTNFPSSPPYRGKSQKRNVASTFHPSYSITYFVTGCILCTVFFSRRSCTFW